MIAFMSYQSVNPATGCLYQSVYGRELSNLGIQEFVNKKLVHISSIDAAA